MPVTFNVGPSQLSDAVRRDISELADSGVLSESHRGEVVPAILSSALVALRAAMRIPDDYAIVLQPSATASMELLLRNLALERTYHVDHGAFSARFADTAERLGYDAARLAPAPGHAPERADLDVPEGTELISVPHCETSTGIMWSDEALAALRHANPAPLLAVDVTSTFGALVMDWGMADVWFSSVQKCLGLPAGLAVVIAGPRAMARAHDLGTRRRVALWQDLPDMVERLERGHTLETPNAFAIALLDRQMKRWDLAATDAATREKAHLVQQAAGEARLFVTAAPWRSLTAHTILTDDPRAWKARALAAGYVLGAGYGDLKERAVRIATFPSVSIDDVQGLLHSLELAAAV